MKKTVSTTDSPVLLIRLFVSLFFIILWLPLVQMNFPFISEVNVNEKRKLAEKPGIRQLIDPSKYVKDYGLYFNDRYGFRSSLVRLNSFLHLTVFNASTTQDVIIGKHGWLMYDSPTDGVNLKDYYGKANFTEDELKRFINVLSYCHEELKKRNIHFLFIIVPNKHTIYPEYLPDNIRQAQGRKTRIDQVTQAMKNADIDFIDLRFRLIDEKKHNSAPLYYKTDTHWNDLGAFFAYEEIMTHLLRIYPGIKKLSRDDFIVRSEENRGTGDLADLLNLRGLLSDTYIKLTPKIKFAAIPMPLPAEYASLKKWHPIAFQRPNPDLPVLVMFRDSFGAMLTPYLSEGFSKSTYLDNRVLAFPVIEREKPAIVIYEIVERDFYVWAK